MIQKELHVPYKGLVRIVHGARQTTCVNKIHYPYKKRGFRGDNPYIKKKKHGVYIKIEQRSILRTSVVFG